MKVPPKNRGNVAPPNPETLAYMYALFAELGAAPTITADERWPIKPYCVTLWEDTGDQDG